MAFSLEFTFYTLILTSLLVIKTRHMPLLQVLVQLSVQDAILPEILLERSTIAVQVVTPARLTEL